MSDRDPGRADLHDDEQLLAELGSALDALEPVPADALATAKAAFDLGAADAELAELVFDSLLDEAPVAMRHDGAEVRSLGFTARGYRVDIELLEEDAVLLGQVEPVQAGQVVLETAADRRGAEVDALGRFQFSAVRGSLRLRLTLGAAGVVVVTPWISW